MSDHTAVEIAEAGSSRFDSTGPAPLETHQSPGTPLIRVFLGKKDPKPVLFTYLKPTQEDSEKIGKWMIIFIEVVVFVLFLGGLIATLTDHLVKKNHVIWVYAPWKWCVLVLVIVGSRHIMGWMVNVVVLLINNTFPTSLLKKIYSSSKYTVYYSYYIYSLKKSIRAVLSFGTVLLAWFFLFKSGGVKASKRDSLVLKYVKRSLATAVIGRFLWVLKTLLVSKLSSPFQATRLFDRFRESLIDQYILHVFSANDNGAEARKNVDKWINDNHLPPYDGSAAGGDGGVNAFNCLKKIKSPENVSASTDGGVKVVNWLKNIETEKISAWTMKELIEVIRYTQLSSITEKLENLAKKEQDMKILVEKTRDVANQIFRRMNRIRQTERSTLRTLFNDEAGDVVQHINSGKEMALKEKIMLEWLFNEEAGDGVQDTKGGEIVAGNEGRMLGRQALLKWLVEAVIERRSVAQCLENTESTIKELNKLISVTALTMLLILWLIMLGILTTKALVAILTQFVALAFIFGDTGKNIFQGIVFVFVMHPFDIGDCCLIDGEEMVVERINLLSSVFRKNGKDTMIFPNSYLISSPINKIKRVKSEVESEVESQVEIQDESQVINDSVEISISSSTSTEQLAYLRRQIQRFLKDHEDRWLLKHNFRLKEIEDQKLKIVLGVSYRKKEPISEEEIVMCRRDLLVSTLKSILEEGSITYHCILFKAIDAE